MALKDDVIAAVAGRTPIDERERDCIEQFLDHIRRLGDDPFNEHRGPVHVTTSALIVGWRGVVLHRHKLLGIWVAPGGHIDPGETPWEAAVREATEETGLSVSHITSPPTLIHVDVHAGPRGHTHLDLRYLLAGADADPARPPNESQDVAWFSWPDAIAIAEPCMTGILHHLETSR